MVRDLGRPPDKSWLDRIDRIDGKINSEAVETLRRTTVLLRSKSIALRAVFPAVAKSFWKVNGDVASGVAEQLGSLSANTPDGSIYEDDLFFDTYYHLNEQGREIRARELAAILDRVFETESLTIRSR